MQSVSYEQRTQKTPMANFTHLMFMFSQETFKLLCKPVTNCMVCVVVVIVAVVVALVRILDANRRKREKNWSETTGGLY